jgi:plasmid maintenance system antidote protein VapI
MPNQIARYLQWRVREWVSSGKTAAELAKLGEISGAQVSEVQNHAVGVGWKTADALAKAFGMTMPTLIAAATEWAAQDPAPAPPSVAQAAGRAHRRAVAADLAREDGISEEAIRDVLAAPASPADADASTVWWILRMRRRDLELAEAPRLATPEESGEVRTSRPPQPRNRAARRQS